jgi:S1-C subfamily serine protease
VLHADGQHTHVDMGSTGDMPSPYCEGPWKQWVMGMGVMSAVALAISIEEHYRVGAGQASAPVVEPLGATPTLGDGPVMPVAALRPLLGPAAEILDSSGRTLGQKPRTPFNEAAQSIRPSVVGVRAALANGAGRSSVERVGSGVIVDPAGYIVTCNHVVVGAAAITISRFEQPERQLVASLVGVDADLALLAFQPDVPLTAATLADSDQVQVGDWVLAVGHPFGLGLTVTSGIVGRRNGVLNIRGGPQYTELLQTDAPINEGSSGGPLVNLSGEVIGLNTAIYAPTGVFSGAGFAVPSNRIRQFLARFIPGSARGVPRSRSLLGVNVANLTPDQLAQFPNGGVVVLEVTPNSPAATLRLAPGDVIVNVAEQPVLDVTTLRQLEGQLASAASVQLQVSRQGRTYNLLMNTPTRAPAG